MNSQPLCGPYLARHVSFWEMKRRVREDRGETRAKQASGGRQSPGSLGRVVELVSTACTSLKLPWKVYEEASCC